jgi:hypothetical protein
VGSVAGIRVRHLPVAGGNISSAAALSVLQVTVAACPPLVLLLAVELLNGALKQRSRETGSKTTGAGSETSSQALETGTDNGPGLAAAIDATTTCARAVIYSGPPS